MSEQQFQVGQRVALKSGLTGVIQSVSMDEDGLLYVVHCDVDSFVYDTHRRVNELVAVAPVPDDTVTRLERENAALREALKAIVNTRKVGEVLVASDINDAFQMLRSQIKAMQGTAHDALTGEGKVDDAHS